MGSIRFEIVARVLVVAGSLGAACSGSSKPCSPIPCPAPGFDQNTCECSKPQVGDAGNSAGGSAGAGADAGAGGMSGAGEAGAGEAGAGEAGAAAQGGAGGDTCPAPTANTGAPSAFVASSCPDKLIVYPAQRVDLVDNCYLPEEAVSCDGPLAAEVNACWVKLDTGDIYTQSVLPCMPDGWRDCTQIEKDSIVNIVTNCK